jgi:phosphoenolpyruvate carboxykinase (GTP)
MSIQDFVAISLGKYVKNNLDFGKKFKNPPLVLRRKLFPPRQRRQILQRRPRQTRLGKVDGTPRPRRSRLRRSHQTGLIPNIEDLQKLFKEVLKKDYTQADYVSQFYDSR